MQMAEADGLGVAGFVLGVVSLGWLVIQHVLDRRVRLLWDVKIGTSIENRAGDITVVLLNRGATVLVDAVAVASYGPSLEEMSDEDFRKLVERERREERTSGFQLPKLLNSGLGTREAIKIESRDCLVQRIPYELSRLNQWPPERFGISVVLRDGRETFVPWTEISTTRKRSRFRRWHPRHWFGWMAPFR